MPSHQIRAAQCALTRLAPGALLLFAVTGIAPSAVNEPWKCDTIRPPTGLVRALARATGLATDDALLIPIGCPGLTLGRSGTVPSHTHHHEQLDWSRSAHARLVRNEDLRFISGTIDPPFQTRNCR